MAPGVPAPLPAAGDLRTELTRHLVARAVDRLHRRDRERERLLAAGRWRELGESVRAHVRAAFGPMPFGDAGGGGGRAAGQPARDPPLRDRERAVRVVPGLGGQRVRLRPARHGAVSRGGAAGRALGQAARRVSDTRAGVRQPGLSGRAVRSARTGFREAARQRSLRRRRAHLPDRPLVEPLLRPGRVAQHRLSGHPRRRGPEPRRGHERRERRRPHHAVRDPVRRPHRLPGAELLPEPHGRPPGRRPVRAVSGGPVVEPDRRRRGRGGRAAGRHADPDAADGRPARRGVSHRVEPQPGGRVRRTPSPRPGTASASISSRTMPATTTPWRRCAASPPG